MDDGTVTIVLADDHLVVRSGLQRCSRPSPTSRSWPRRGDVDAARSVLGLIALGHNHVESAERLGKTYRECAT